ncbi:hypothetical protein J6590_013169 [Homalodisca vitripennis]|nr:hypothetical protein J6590_013169 [Homalodisca vitripennis]
MDLLEFRSDVSRALVTVGKTVKTRKRGRPSLDEEEGDTIVRRGRNEVRPTNEVIYDTVDHLPQHDDKSEPTSYENLDKVCCLSYNSGKRDLAVSEWKVGRKSWPGTSIVANVRRSGDTAPYFTFT